MAIKCYLDANKHQNMHGDIIIVPRAMLDTIVMMYVEERELSIPSMYADTVVGKAWDFKIIDNITGDALGHINDFQGGCELCVFYTADLFELLGVHSANAMLDKFHTRIEDSGFKRDDLNPLGTHSQYFEIKNFNGDVNYAKYAEEPSADTFALCFDGTDGTTENHIHIVVSPY